MATRTFKQEEVDDLVAEAVRLRDELMRAATRLEVFAAQLVSEVDELRTAAGEHDDPVSG